MEEVIEAKGRERGKEERKSRKCKKKIGNGKLEMKKPEITTFYLPFPFPGTKTSSELLLFVEVPLFSG